MVLSSGVIDRRKGLPVALGILFIDVARRVVVRLVGIEDGKIVLADVDPVDAEAFPEDLAHFARHAAPGHALLVEQDLADEDALVEIADHHHEVVGALARQREQEGDVEPRRRRVRDQGAGQEGEPRQDVQEERPLPLPREQPERVDDLVSVPRADRRTLRRLRLTTIAMVFQQFGLLPWRSVRENVGLGLELGGVERGRRDEIVARQLEMVGLSEWADRRVA